MELPCCSASLADGVQGSSYKLTADVGQQLIEEVNGHTALCDEAAARKGRDWMREQYRAVGETPRF